MNIFVKTVCHIIQIPNGDRRNYSWLANGMILLYSTKECNLCKHDASKSHFFKTTKAFTDCL